MRRLHATILLLVLIALVAPAFAAYQSATPPPRWTKPSTTYPTGGYTPGPFAGERARAASRLNSNNKIIFDELGRILTPTGGANMPAIFTAAAGLAGFVAKRSFIVGLLAPELLNAMKNWLVSAGLTTYIDPITGQQVWVGPPPNASATYYAWGSVASTDSLTVIQAWADWNGVPLDHTSMVNGELTGWLVGYPNYPFKPTKLQCPQGQVWVGPGPVCGPSVVRPLTQAEFESAVSPLSIPPAVVDQLPYPVPVDDPLLNPSPYPNGVSVPFFVPTGDPLPYPSPRPDPDPNPYHQPGVLATPSPKPSPNPDPWRVDVKPVDKPQPSPTPNPNPNPNTGDGTATSATTPPVTGPTPTPTPADNPGLCDLFPDILACLKLGDPPAADEIPNKDIPTSITPASGFGADNGTCPPDKILNLHLVGTVPISWELPCRYASGLRPVIIAMAWLTAAFIFMGAIRKD